MEWILLLKAVLSLILVLGLLLVTLWALKYMQINGSRCRFLKKLDGGHRLKIVETRRIDAKNSAVLLRRDNIEHLIILGASNLVVENGIPAPASFEGDTND